MKKTVFCLFAHPDDEAFGPAGTIAKMAQDFDIYLICATRGEASTQTASQDEKQLAKSREQELFKSAKILGIKKVFFLDYHDGFLSNHLYHEIAKKIENIIRPFQPEILLTYEPHGISGHLDHIAISLITSYLFERAPYVKQLYYYCIDELERRLIGYSFKFQKYFIFFPPGYKKSDVNLTVNINDFWSYKIKAIQAHQSQEKDVRRTLIKSLVLWFLRGFKHRENFLVQSK